MVFAWSRVHLLSSVALCGVCLVKSASAELFSCVAVLLQVKIDESWARWVDAWAMARWLDAWAVGRPT